MKQTQILIVLLLFSAINAIGQGIVNYSGVVKDSRTGEVLEGINIVIAEKNTGTISDERGEFFIFLSPGIYNVNFSCEGYKTEKFMLDLRENKFSEIVLVPTNEIKKKNDMWLKRKNNSLEQVRLEKQKMKTVKSS